MNTELETNTVNHLSRKCAFQLSVWAPCDLYRDISRNKFKRYVPDA